MTREESQKEWGTRIIEFKASGQSQTAWCKTKKINRRKFTYWFAKFKNTISQANKPSSWIALKASELEENSKESVLTVKIGQAIIEVKSDFDSKLFVSIVKVLSSLC